MINQFSKYFVSLLLLLFSPLFLIFLLPIYAFRLFVGKVVIKFYPKIDKILTTRSSCSGAEPLYDNPKCSLIVVNIVEGTLTVDHFRYMFQTRVIDPKHSNGKFQKPEFQQYVTKLWGFLFWKWEENFDLKEHILMYDGKFKDAFQNGSKPVNAETVVEAGDEYIYEPFPRQKSPWKIQVFHNYRESDPLTGKPVGPVSTVLQLKIHHCLGDGFSIMKVFNYDMTKARELETALPRYIQPKGSPIIRVLEFLLTAPYEFLRETRNAIDVNSWHVPQKQLKRKMNSCISHAIPIEYLKEAKNGCRATFTALILECFTAAVRKFMMEAGYDVPDTIHCVTPLPVPGHPSKMRNHMTGCFTTLPVGMADSTKRLEAIEKNLLHLKKSTFPLTMFHMMVLVGGLFSWMIPTLSKNERTTAIMSNFPGPNNLLSFDNYKVTSMWFGGGFHDGNCGMGFSSLSYGGTVRIAVAIDEGIVSKSQLPARKLIKYFLEEVEKLRRETIV